MPIMKTEPQPSNREVLAGLVERFAPTDDFKPSKPYLTRIKWRDRDGREYSKLLLAKPETVIAVALRGESESGSDRKPRRHAAQQRKMRPRAALRAENR
jgi:hypothetical protein